MHNRQSLKISSQMDYPFFRNPCQGVEKRECKKRPFEVVRWENNLKVSQMYKTNVAEDLFLNRFTEFCFLTAHKVGHLCPHLFL